MAKHTITMPRVNHFAGRGRIHCGPADYGAVPQAAAATIMAALNLSEANPLTRGASGRAATVPNQTYRLPHHMTWKY